MLAKVRYDKRTTNFDPEEERYWMHFLKGDPMIGDHIRSQMRQNPTFRRELFNQHICERCEKFTFFHKGGVMCPSCGHFSPEGKTHKVKIHLAGGHFR